MKSKSYFIDIDGVVFMHWGKGASLQWSCHELLKNVVEFIDKLEARGDQIILITARKECTRTELESKLRSMGIYWDQLIMGITSGERIIVNDKKPNGEPSCKAIELERNQGCLELC